MRIWIIQDGEPLPGIDPGTRDWRCSILSKELLARGHQVLWWASTFDHAQKKFRRNKPCTIETETGMKFRLLHGPGYNSNKNPRRFLHQRAIGRAFAHEAVNFPVPDIIFCGLPLPELAEQAIIYGHKYDVPAIIDVRDQWPDIYLTMVPSSLQRFARLLLSTEFRRMERVFQSASAIVSISETYLNWALKYAGRARCSMDRVFALGHNAPNRTVNETDIASVRAKYGIHPDNMVVTFVGIFGFSYDLETVIHAAKILQDYSQPRIQFVLVGDGDAGPRLREMARSIPNLICTGWLDRDSIQVLLGLSSVGLAAYTANATQSLPNKPFEYMATGLPLLSSLHGELEQLIAEQQIGLQYRAGDAKSLVEKIVWLAEHPDERIEMSQRAYKLFEKKFRSDIIYPELAAHLEKIADATAMNG